MQVSSTPGVRCLRPVVRWFAWLPGAAPSGFASSLPLHLARRDGTRGSLVPKLTNRLRPISIAPLLGLLVAAGACGSEPEIQIPSLPVERFQLANGLEVVLHPEPALPLAYVSVWYRVGGSDDEPGKSGLAHLVEHMMFEGSQHVKAGDHFRLLGAAGTADANASTSADRTNYYQTVPAHQLETALWLESDRMGYLLPALDEGRFAIQRDVVRNERRQRYENVGYGGEQFAVGEALYPEGHPYRHLTIGRHEDLERLTIEDARAFLRRWYVPSNATLLVAGAIDVAATRGLVQKWFGGLPKQPRPTHATAPAARISGPLRKTVEDRFAGLRRLRFVWPSPASGSEDEAALDVLAEVLGTSPTGRLWQRLVYDEQLARRAFAFQYGRKLGGEFHVGVDLAPGAIPSVVERALLDEIDRLTTDLVPRRHLDQIVTEAEVDLIAGLETIGERGEAMQDANLRWGDPRAYGEWLRRYRETTPERVRSAARRLFEGGGLQVVTLPAAQSASRKDP